MCFIRTITTVKSHPGQHPQDSHQNGDTGMSCCTRTRLLEAAGEIFAERGFDNATVREICTRAGANVAAVNYYFQGKEGLYAQVVDYAQTCMHSAYPIRMDNESPAEERLTHFIHAFLHRVLDDARPAWHTKLMSREMVEPTAALDRVVASTIRPTFIVLSSILSELLPGAGPDQIRLAGASIIGQCLMHRHCRPVLDRLFPGQNYGEGELKLLAEHITRFSLAGLRGIAASKPAPKPKSEPTSKRRAR
jgi:TetR/AcrR family transcriptional regulator, regulator of cefoperazone and chloramphenicol sensitivity